MATWQGTYNNQKIRAVRTWEDSCLLYVDGKLVAQKLRPKWRMVARHICRVLPVGRWAASFFYPVLGHETRLNAKILRDDGTKAPLTAYFNWGDSMGINVHVDGTKLNRE